jgi:hypothetical protein
MIVKTKNPIEYQDENTTNIETRGGYDGEDVGGFVSFEGEEFIPFDGETELETFLGADGEIYHYSFNNDEYYNAKGQKIATAFGKVFGKDGFIRRNLRLLKGKIKERKKTIASNVKERRDAREVKRGAKKLLAIEKSNAKLRGDAPKITPIEQNDDIPLNAPIKVPTTKIPKTAKQNELKIDAIEEITTIQNLPKKTENTPAENIISYKNEDFDDEGRHDDIQLLDDGTGKKRFVHVIPTKDVVAVTAEDGKIDYYKKNDVEGEGMTLTIKILIGVGAVVALGLITFLIVKRKK